VPPGAEFHNISVTDLDGRLGEWRIDAAIHFAARSLVGESTQEPSLYWRNNVVGTVALLDSLRAYGVDRIVFSSSAAAYGDVDDQPIHESAAARPTSPYGSSKLAVDLLLTDYARAYGLAAVSLRYFNVAGAFQSVAGHSFGERHDPETHLIPNALRAAREGSQFSLFGTDYPTPDGTCVRDYIHVVDLGEAHLRALIAAEAGSHQVVNLGSGRGYSNREVLLAVGEVTGTDVPITEAPRRAGDPAELIASNEQAAEFLGWTPTRDLREMVADAWRFEQERS
jgi:UDP-glucose 4-epimerase